MNIKIHMHHISNNLETKTYISQIKRYIKNYIIGIVLIRYN